MSDEKQARPMTAKKFAKIKLGAKNTAEGLLAAHMSFLENHEFLKDILQAYKDKELLPTPTFQCLQNLLFTHAIESEAKTAQATIQKNIEAHEKAPKDKDGKVIVSSVPSGNYLVTLMVKAYDANDEATDVEVGTIETERAREVERDGKMVIEKYLEVSPAIWGADDYGSAERMADRRLVSREDSVYAIIENTIGQKVTTHVFRGDAFARFYRKQKQPFCRVRGKSTKTLKMGGKASQTRVIQARW